MCWLFFKISAFCFSFHICWSLELGLSAPLLPCFPWMSMHCEFSKTIVVSSSCPPDDERFVACGVGGFLRRRQSYYTGSFPPTLSDSNVDIAIYLFVLGICQIGGHYFAPSRVACGCASLFCVDVGGGDKVIDILSSVGCVVFIVSKLQIVIFQPRESTCWQAI